MPHKPASPMIAKPYINIPTGPSHQPQHHRSPIMSLTQQHGSINVPTGWRVERHTLGRMISFDIYETDGPTWPGGGSRPALTVELRPNTDEERYGAPAGPEISWPSTSDQRPALALALAAALQMAAAEVTA